MGIFQEVQAAARWAQWQQQAAVWSVSLQGG
jgi:hypothetical protein